MNETDTFKMFQTQSLIHETSRDSFFQGPVDGLKSCRFVENENGLRERGGKVDCSRFGTARSDSWSGLVSCT